ncbi:pyruvate dehydrogenase (acetyl-transferring), homodimeric type [Corynebacterium bovis]|uniref:Pyruvate dehydrogenase E1 component n=3 Tax=Corynebacterium bovis TaxID=36808 RepID=A0A3R8RF68_9CORY|nr:pyruvate dehydrogenase (acetyl-transferring), homodimeric type [Corynebacterium bovis]MDN8579700.1 pyruvate dehydrogenase (acetyl-transferring), homodimeric type [Corynebacterium bovis]RRO87693.1 pyruvate dehydrogenase (acetyl-transferring), homodimeric type [Corynebacterium bovis]RRO88838.1 pyruvate dehydrogenase (acetyl-transferring), homodimeric type [Corynebacterium bovis]RRO92038.1 pyruvate dehydrogenase (acetyl-transferring), homodimeric type [Corynebacterium bovis]RRO96836.1 pyruvate
MAMDDDQNGAPHAQGTGTTGQDPRRDSNVALLRDGVASYLRDSDPEETQEWMDSLDGLLDEAGPERARYLVLRLLERATAKRVALPPLTSTDYVNTIPTWMEPDFPGDEEIEKRYRRWMRWNAAIMVHRAQRPGIGVGGHISTYASAAALYEVGFNHFFRGKDHPGGGDHVFFQGHASPGMYARAFLEGRLSEEDMDGFRQEVTHPGGGLPSYPHPYGMPHFWEFPTVSMGLGPMNAIYQARFNRYLHDRGLKDTSQQHVWAFLGDGEMDEPESRGLIQTAAVNNLDNLTFVINCNLQRLDGPVRGNTKIIQELESFFRGAGWNVIKVVWGREWDRLIEADTDGALVNAMNTVPDGDFQTFKANDGAYVREYFFNKDPRTAELVKDLTDDEIWQLHRGGHDYRKVYAAYRRAMETKDQPTVILAHTIKGYGLGHNFEGRNATHQMKKLSLDDLKLFRDKQGIPISDEELEKDPYLPPYYNPGPDSEEIRYMLERRRELGGFLPERRDTYEPLEVPEVDAIRSVLKGSGKQEVATTMALVRIFKDLMRDPTIRERLVPIIPDEARTFGMDSWFPTLKIYNPHGQQYTPVDQDLMLSYREATDGHILHEGINEAGSVGSFIAAGTSYATHGTAMIPLYIFYSMFGFQRTGDSIWAAGDQMARGFLIGATAGRTTLTGEGLQHMDGHSPVLSSTNPAVVSWDPAFAYELAYIIRDGIDRMYGPGRGENVIYYLTVYNQPMNQPARPEDLDVEGLLKGIYLYSPADRSVGTGAETAGSVGAAPQRRHRATILASGVGMGEAVRAKQILEDDYDVNSAIYSVTSWNELARDGQHRDREALRHPDEDAGQPFVRTALADAEGPVVAVTDFSVAVPEQIRKWVPGDYSVLGCDGFGFSDTREGARRYFNSDAESVVVAVLAGLARAGEVDGEVVTKAAERFRLTDPTAVRHVDAPADGPAVATTPTTED